MILDRIRLLIRAKELKVERLAQITQIPYSRWNNVIYGKTKIRHEEVEALGNAFPEHKLWLAYGDTSPEAGQIAPRLPPGDNNKERMKRLGKAKSKAGKSANSRKPS